MRRLFFRHGSGRLARRVISGTRSHHKPILSLRFSVHLNVAKRAIRSAIRGRIRDGVLVTNVGGDVRADRHEQEGETYRDEFRVS